MNVSVIYVLVIINLINTVSPQVAISELSKIGIIKAKNYNLKIKGTSKEQFIVIKMLPNLNVSHNCSTPSLESYKRMVSRVITPISNALVTVRSAIHERASGLRFWGAVIGGVALGVATSAQITAGIALHQAQQNAAAIMDMKDAIIKSNQAIQKLHNAAEQTVLAISGLQQQINSNIIPFINKMKCDDLDLKLGLQLNQYFSEISLVFGPNLRDPASETISIQALSRAFNNDFESLLKNLGYSGEDLLDILQSNSIRARIIDVSLTDFFLILQVEYPTLTTVSEAVIQNFNLISYNFKGDEWMSVFPSQILIRGTFLSNIDISGCTQTNVSYICPHDTSSPMSTQLYNCATGKLNECARTRVVNSHVARYALSDGVLFANCMPISCVCKTTSQSIIQDSSVTNVMIHSGMCEEVLIDGFYITLGKKQINRVDYVDNVTVGSPVVLDPIDVGNQLSSIQKELADSKDLLDKSNEILRRINPRVITTSSYIFMIVLITVLTVWSIIAAVWLYYLTRRYNNISNYSRVNYNNSTVNSLSSLIPTISR